MPKVDGEAFDLEDDFQEEVVKLFRTRLTAKTIWLHVPNGAHRHIAVARKLRKLGVRPGAPDFFLFNAAVPDIALELKAKNGSQEDEQRDFQAVWEAQHKLYFVCKTMRQVTAILDHFLLY